MYLFSLIVIFAYYQKTTTARFIPTKDEIYSNNLYPQEGVIQDPYSPGIRILINTSSRRSSPYILLRRRTNTNLKLRISKDMMNDNGPLRIVYRPRNIVASDSTGPFYTNSQNLRNSENNVIKPFYRTRGRANIRISTRGLKNMRIRS